MEKITAVQLENWFTFHTPNPEQIAKYREIRDAGLNLAMTIVNNCPASADTTAAIRKVRESVMNANASIACNGQ